MWLAIALHGCLTATPPAAQGCTSCHGSATSAAPPSALGGGTDRSLRGVGAHEVHLAGSDLAGPAACTECHVVPATVDAPGHIDTDWPAEVAWGELSRTGASPWDAAEQTCTVYCHGATLTGGPGASPAWTSVDGLGCAGCHGFPPPPPHPDAPDCGSCHLTLAGGAMDVTLHVDGILQLAGGTTPTTTGDTGTPGNPCVGCHGSGDNPAPSTNAHDPHVLGTAESAAVACGDCHPVPVAVSDAGHLDGTVQVAFSGDATVQNHRPSWDGGAKTCTETACHARGGTTPTPDWTVVDGSQVACDSCHGTPPPPPAHPANPTCEQCHGTAGPSLTITDAAGHVDGSVDF